MNKKAIISHVQNFARFHEYMNPHYSVDFQGETYWAKSPKDLVSMILDAQQG